MTFVRLAVLLVLTFFAFSMGQTPPSGLNAFAWACKSQVQKVATASDPWPPASTTSDELRKLAQLRADGILTEEEFAGQKAKLLQS